MNREQIDDLVKISRECSDLETAHKILATVTSELEAFNKKERPFYSILDVINIGICAINVTARLGEISIKQLMK